MAAGERTATGAGPRPLRLVVTSTSRSWGGNEEYALQVVRGLAGRGVEPLLAWSHPAVGERAAAAGVPHVRLGLRGDLDLAGLLRLARLLARGRADCVLLTRWREYLLGGLAARLAGVPWTVLRLGLRLTPRDDAKRRLVFRLADRVLVNAEEIRQALRERPWIDPARIRVVRNGVDLQRFRPGGDGGPFRRELDLPAGAPLVGTVGALSPQKDHDTFLRAAARVLRRRPEARFVIVGEGFLRPAVEGRLDELGLRGRVVLAGERRDVRPALAALDLFVLSSTNEGMSRALLEAVACGLPVVATAVSGSADLVRPDGGLLVPAADPGALAGAILELLADPDRRAAMGAAARGLAEREFGLERMLAGTLAVLREGPRRS